MLKVGRRGIKRDRKLALVTVRERERLSLGGLGWLLRGGGKMAAVDGQDSIIILCDVYITSEGAGGRVGTVGDE